MADDCTQRGVLERAHDEYEAVLAAEAVPDGIETVRGEAYMKNGKGALIPVEVIAPGQKLQDQTARRLIGKALRMSRIVQQFRQELLADIDAFIQLQDEHYGTKRGGVKGNVTLMSFDQVFKVERTVGEFIDFGPEIDAARKLAQECLEEWKDGARPELRLLVERAFEKGRNGIRRTELLNLLTYQIEDERWQRAMTALKDSIQTRGTKEYVRFYRRADHRAKWTPISIDVASDMGDAA